ncbi:MAG: BlaI/MecI/CopY family transcriptional regulator [Candidatus Zixiibacteriota bacterium]
MTAEPFYFDITGEGIGVFMGPTEARLMELAWRHQSLTVKSALALLEPNQTAAYTTVMTVLNRLVQKGLLLRDKDGRNFVYRPAVDREQFIRSRVGQVEDCLTRNFPVQGRRKRD